MSPSPAAAPDLPVTPASTPPRRLPRWARVSLWSVGTLAVLALAWTLLIGSWLPGFIKPRIEAAGSDALGTPVTLDRISIAPWKLVVQLDGLRVGEAAAPLFTLGSAQTQLSLQSLSQRAPVLTSLTLQQPRVNVQRLSAERFNFSAVLDHLRDRAAAQPATSPSAEPARFALHNIRLEGGELHYRDAVLQTEHHVEGLRVGLPFISSLPSDVETEVQPLLEATIDGSALRLDGHVRPFASTRPAELALNLQGVKLADWASLLRAVLPAEFAPQTLQGQLDTKLAISFEARPEPAPPSLRVRGELAISGFDLAVPTQGVTAAWQSFKLEEIDLAPLERKHALARIVIDGLKLQLVRQKPGAVVAKPVAAASAASAASGAASAVTAATEAPPPLQWQLGELRCTGCAVQLRDAGMTPPVQLDLADIELALKNLAGPASAPIGFDLALQLSAAAGNTKPSPGTLKLAGDVSGLLPGPAGAALPLALNADIGLDAIDLRALQPYLSPYLNLTLVGAKIGTTGQLKVAAPAGAGFAPESLRVDYRGAASLAELKTQDSVNGADFVGWRRLALDGLAVGWQGGPGGGAVDADLGRISLDGLQARVILHPDAHLNLADIVKREAGAAPQSITTPQAGQTAPAPAPAAASGPAAAPMKLRWQAITLRDGTVQFTDNFIKPNYSARLTQLKGEVSALSSAAPEPAKVTIAGALDDGAPLRIAGRLHPLGARLYTDIEASARGIALTRMSTYAERYAGYAIEKGSMSVTVHYKIEQGKLEAENQLFLDQLTFGDAVDSPDALKLPVRLAVALLKNSRGEIDLRMPVAGTLDDPQFSVGGIVWQVVLNLLERAVTAPFAMLFGGDSNEASHLAFAAGSAELDAAARERLDTMAQRLGEKPTLKLEATGRADPLADGAALQAAHAAQAQAAAAASAASAAKPSARVTASAAASAPAAAASAPVPALEPAALERALRALADQRADRVMAYLATQLPAERVLLTRSQITSARPDGDQGPASRVQFELR
jgi:outer membrane protein OmpA-like peptidoglycan-associated protein